MFCIFFALAVQAHVRMFYDPGQTGAQNRRIRNAQGNGDGGFSTNGPCGGAATWGLNRINADQRGRTGSGATVFVLDTGVRSSHEEFSGRSSSALDLTSGSPVVCNSNLNCANDRQGHGTHCAGTAAGVTYGVAPTAKVEAVKVLDDSGSGYWSWSYYALDWLATSTVRPAVASMSLGGSGTQQAMKDAVDGAVNAGVVVVVAGGNSNADACNFSPAFVPSAITVGSTTSNDARSSFSNSALSKGAHQQNVMSLLCFVLHPLS